MEARTGGWFPWTAGPNSRPARCACCACSVASAWVQAATQHLALVVTFDTLQGCAVHAAPPQRACSRQAISWLVVTSALMFWCRARCARRASAVGVLMSSNKRRAREKVQADLMVHRWKREREKGECTPASPWLAGCLPACLPACCTAWPAAVPRYLLRRYMPLPPAPPSPAQAQRGVAVWLHIFSLAGPASPALLVCRLFRQVACQSSNLRTLACPVCLQRLRRPGVTGARRLSAPSPSRRRAAWAASS